MIFRNLDGEGDWTFGAGRSSYATASDAVALNIKTRLQFWLNDFFSAMQFGIDWRNLLGAKNPGAQEQIILQTRVMLKQSFGVTRIISVSAAVPQGTRRLRLQYQIATIYSRSVRQTVELGF